MEGEGVEMRGRPSARTGADAGILQFLEALARKHQPGLLIFQPVNGVLLVVRQLPGKGQ